MAKYIDVQGNTIAEAIQSGLNQLDLMLEEVTTEVLSRPKSGFFGFGASKAKVRLTVKEEEKVEIIETISKSIAKKSDKVVLKSVEKTIDKTPKPQTNIKPRLEETEQVFTPSKTKETLDETDLKVKEFVDGLLSKMGINGNCVVLDLNDDDININIVGENMGNVIGRRGDTLDAIQYITNLVLKNSSESAKRVRVDCENYRIKRKQTLEKLALKMGHKVIKYKKNMTLEPMNPYERRMIHEVLQNFRGVTTYSTGKEPNRRVVIGYGEKTEK